MTPVTVAFGTRELLLAEATVPLPLDELIPGSGPWEIEIGFGKGRYLLRRAISEGDGRFLGIEVASEYYRLVRARAVRRRLDNLLLLRGEALYLLSAVLPTGFASAVHVYFPDPWPKARHQARRLFDTETIDLVLGLLRPEGILYFATDFLEYGERVAEILDSHPEVVRHAVDEPWGGEARTNYEAKYVREGRPITRFEVEIARQELGSRIHPDAVTGLRSAVACESPGLATRAGEERS